MIIFNPSPASTSAAWGPQILRFNIRTLWPCLSTTTRIVQTKILYSIQFHYVAVLAPPYGLNPWPKNHELNNFRKRFHLLHAFSFYKICMGVEKTVLYSFHIFLLNGNIGSNPRACPRGMHFTILVGGCT